MNQNIEKILYLSAGFLFSVLAIAIFFSHYDYYQAYLHQGERLVLEDKNVTLSGEHAPWIITGDKVLHQVLEKRKQDDALYLYHRYSDISVPSGMDNPEIWVEKINSAVLDLSLFNPRQNFHAVYEIDPSGKIVLIRYVKN